MAETRLEELNLNLLLALHWILVEQGVTPASNRMGVTQSAMSRSLAQLRLVFDDPLLVGRGTRLRLSPRAVALRAPLSRAMDALRVVLRPPEGPEQFDPSFAHGSLRVAATEHGMRAVVERALPQAVTAAPNLDIQIEPAGRDVFARVEGGHLDLLVAPKVGSLAPVFRSASILAERFVVVVRRKHPLAGARWTLPRYQRYPHVLVCPVGGEAEGVVDRALHRLGRERRVALRVPYFESALRIVAGSDLIATVPASVVEESDRRFQVSAPPLEVPGFLLEAVWHERVDDDPRHMWLRGQIGVV
ncbi:MAG: LysR family transcriptional regulator [Nannocystales bacterium]